jgi:hypothetical protein
VSGFRGFHFWVGDGTETNGSAFLVQGGFHHALS